MRKIRVILAEDHHVVRAAVATFIAQEPDIEVVGEAADGNALLDMIGGLDPNIVVLDAHMPGRKVIQTAQTLRRDHPQVQILVLSAYERREYVVGLLQAGAAGYVLKDDTPEMLIKAIRAVADGKEWVSPRVASILVKSVRNAPDRPAARLTRREMDVLRLMAAGYKNDEIAEALVITVQTVKNHVRSILRKLGVDSRVEAVLYAISHGLERP